MSREIRAVSGGVISKCTYVRMQRHAESTLTRLKAVHNVTVLVFAEKSTHPGCFRAVPHAPGYRTNTSLSCEA